LRLYRPRRIHHHFGTDCWGDKRFGCFMSEYVFLNQFIHNPPVFFDKQFIVQFPKKNIFLLSVICPIGVNPNEIRRDIPKYWVYLLFGFDLAKIPSITDKKSFNKTMLYHEWTACYHFCKPQLVKKHGFCIWCIWVLVNSIHPYHIQYIELTLHHYLKLSGDIPCL
jgi:hypothetical protein